MFSEAHAQNFLSTCPSLLHESLCLTLYDSAARPALPLHVSLANLAQELPAWHPHTTKEVIRRVW